LPRKNVKPLLGKPLIAYTIEAALGSYFLNRIVVSTEDEEIANIAKEYGVQVIKRPKKLAQDKTLIQPVLEQVLKYLERTEDYKPYGIVLLNPTSPLRTTQHIDKAVHTFLHGTCDTLFTVYGCHMCLWKIDNQNKMAASYDFIHKARRQDMPQEYAENGAVYIMTREYFLRTHRLIGGRMKWSIMPRANSIDINNELDFIIAEALLKDMDENPSHQS
jgi:CMP-N,N'-diacetyllegionaminic acid synthase